MTDPAPPGAWPVRLVALATAAAALPVQLAIIAPNHDNAYLLHIAGQMLAGGRYYADFLELNPPLYPLLLIPVHGLHRATGIGLHAVFLAAVTALVGLVGAVIGPALACLLRLGRLDAMALAGLATAALVILPGQDYGQREHVALLLLLPAVVWAAGRKPGAPAGGTGLVVAVPAAIGLLVKPFLLLVAGAVLTVTGVRLRTARVLLEPPIRLAAATAVLYGITLVLVFPEWFDVAAVARIAYRAYDETGWVDQRVTALLAAITALAVTNEAVARGSARALGRTVAGAAFGGALSYIAQHKGWDYHFLPGRMLTFGLGGVVLLAAGERLAPWLPAVARHRALLLAVIAALPLARTADYTRFQGARGDRAMRELVAFLDAHHAGPAIAVFATSIYPAHPLALYRPGRTAWRFAQPWLVPWIEGERAVRGTTPEVARMAALQRLLVLDDFRRYRPDALLVDESPEMQALSERIDLLAWFAADPPMAAELAGFARVGQFRDPNLKSRHSVAYGLYLRRQ